MGAVVLAGLVFGAVVVLVPRWARQECIDAAAARGITLSVASASIDASGVRLEGLRATAADLPGASASAPEMTLALSGLRPEGMSVRGAEVTLSGPPAQVEAALARWRASPTGQGDAWTPTSVVVDGSRVVWKRALGDAVTLEASDLHVDLTPGSNPVVHARSDNVRATVSGVALGPWRVDVDRTGGTSRVRVALDPGVPESCTALWVGGDQTPTSVEVSVPRSPVSRLGLPAKALGLPGKDVQLEATLHYSDLGGSSAQLTATGGVHGVELPGMPRGLDVTWQVSAAGDSRQGLDLKKSRLAAGPLVGTVTGTLRTFDDGARVDAAWTGGPVPCNAFDAPLDESQPFDIAYQLRKLAEATGITTVAGQVAARGSITFDTRDPSATRLDAQPQVSCKVALFGQ